MDDQTKSIQTLSIEGIIEHKKHNQIDIKYLHQPFIRNPQPGCLARHYKETLTINEIKSREL